MSDFKLPPIFSVTPPPTVRERLKQLKTQFSLDPEFFSQLILRLTEKENERPHFMELLRNRKGPAPSGWVRNQSRPSRSFTNLGASIISKLIESVFWASLERDEGRALRFSVAYRCVTNVDTDDGSSQEHDIMFENPLPFTVKELKKLGPAVNRNASVLVFADENNVLKIKGISADPFLPLKINIVDPGHLTLSYYGENIAFVSGAEVGFIRFSAFEINTVAVWRRLYANGDENYSSRGDARVQTIVKTLRKMRDLGNGGALIIIPKRKKLTSSVESTAYPSPEGFNHARKQIEEFNEGKDEYNLRQMFLEHYADMLAHLTAVDGATIITRDIELVGFGVKLKSKRALPTIYLTHPIDHPEGWKPVNITEIGNLRHQSAARFVATQKDSVAFVVSQDGNITSIVWIESDDGSEQFLQVDSRLDLTLF